MANLTLKFLNRNYEQYRSKLIEDNYPRGYWVEITQFLHNTCHGDMNRLAACMYYRNTGELKCWSNRRFSQTKAQLTSSRGHNRGTKRPGHSEQMKIKSAFKKKKVDWSPARLEAHSNMNCPAYYRKILKNKGFSTEILSDDQIGKLYGIFRKRVNSSDSYKIAKIKSFIQNPIYEQYYDVDVISKRYTEAIKGDVEALEYLSKLASSIRSTVAIQDPKNNMGRYVSVHTNYDTTRFLYYKGTKATINVRSSWESKFINFLEGACIKWSYEELTFSLGSSYYTPDFLIELDGVEILVEIKGVVYRTDQLEKQQDKFRRLYQLRTFVVIHSIENLTVESLKQNINMQIYKKTHENTLVVEDRTNYLGMSREVILSTLKPDTVFIHDGWYIHVLNQNTVESWLCANGHCRSYLEANFEGGIVCSVHSSNILRSIHERWLTSQSAELLTLKNIK